jgi:hypothetical protein
VFCLVLLGATAAVERLPQMLPCPACRFLHYLDTREVGGERLSAWERVTASLILTGTANKKARDASARPGLVSSAASATF